MNAFLLAAGLGTRLRPVTDHLPKCLVPIGERPLLDIWVRQLCDAGFDRIIVNTHYFADQVEAFVRQSPDRDRLITVHEPRLLGTAGSLLEHRHLWDSGPLLMAHADNLVKCDFSRFLAAHARRPPDTIMTMMLFETDVPESCGIVSLDSAGRMTAFHEKVKNPPSRLANAAVYILEPDVVRLLLNRTVAPVDFSLDVLPHLMGRVFTWKIEGYLRDIGTLAALELGRAEYASL